MKNNGGLIAAIVILSLIVLALAGVIIVKGTKGTTDDTTSKQPGSGTEEVKLTASEVDSLMSKYLIKQCSNYYLTDYTNEDVKNGIAANNINATGSVKCSEKYEGSFNEGSSDYNISDSTVNDIAKWCESDKANTYTYDAILASKKELFGLNSSLANNDFKANNWLYYDYDSSNNAFVALDTFGKGCAAPERTTTIDSFDQSGDVLEVTFTYNEVYGNPSEDKTEKYKYTFKKANEKFYLSSISKVA